MSSLDIAPYPEGLRQVHVDPAAGAGAGYRRLSGGCANCTFWRLDFRQSSFRHITRVPQRLAPYAWARTLVHWHAVFSLPLSSPDKPLDPEMFLQSLPAQR